MIFFFSVKLSCGATGSDNITYLVLNPTSSPGDSCFYRICPSSKAICRLRFDFIVSFHFRDQNLFKKMKNLQSGPSMMLQRETAKPTTTWCVFFCKRDQINCISRALLLVEGLEIPMIWWGLPETRNRWFTAGLWQLDH